MNQQQQPFLVPEDAMARRDRDRTGVWFACCIICCICLGLVGLIIIVVVASSSSSSSSSSQVCSSLDDLAQSDQAITVGCSNTTFLGVCTSVQPGGMATCIISGFWVGGTVDAPIVGAQLCTVPQSSCGTGCACPTFETCIRRLEIPVAPPADGDPTSSDSDSSDSGGSVDVQEQAFSCVPAATAPPATTAPPAIASLKGTHAIKHRTQRCGRLAHTGISSQEVVSECGQKTIAAGVCSAAGRCTPLIFADGAVESAGPTKTNDLTCRNPYCTASGVGKYCNCMLEPGLTCNRLVTNDKQQYYGTLECLDE